MPEKDTNLITGFIATIGTALTLFGFNLKWVYHMGRKVDLVDEKVDKIPEKYIMKADFNHRVDRLEEELKSNMKENFNRIFDKIDDLKK